MLEVMKKTLGLFLVVGLMTAIAAPTSAQIQVCKFGMCSDGGGGLNGGGFSQCTDTYGRVINWRFTDFEGAYERCEWGPPPRFSDKPDGSFALLGGCQSVACGALKSVSAFAPASAGRAPSPALTPGQARVREQVARILGRSVAPSAPVAAYSAIAPAARSLVRADAAPAKVLITPANSAAYTSPAPRAGVTTMPLPAYYSGWMMPTPTDCHFATSDVLCRAAAAFVQGNSMGSPRNSCEWSANSKGIETCKRVQL